MIGTRLGPYEITAKLGEGGMGEVFRARDSRLNREVALKILPAAMGADPERLERFRREAQAVAALNHPNIVTLYSIEEAGGTSFLTMELVEGAALDALIPPEGFDLEAWLEIGTALADAVAAAHAKGIVHRDLKPANIMIGGTGERRQVKVLDFGLARMAESGKEAPANAPTLLTREGVVMGTLPYMSPEQVRGVPLDERTDLFSLGVILYEMAAGRRPFSGGSSVELGSAILRDTPPPLAGRSEKLPADVERILRRCLEKDPRDRIASARALYDELRLLRRDLAVSHGSSGRAPAAPADSGADRAEEGLRVAVLPFRSSGDAEMESIADGLGEEITTGLSRFRYLSVVASASAARLKGEAGDERKLGAKVGARYLLEGSLRKGGSALRVSAQLVDAETGARLWAETYNRDLQTTHLFAAQDDVAARIVATVADTYGVLVHSIRAAMRQKDDADLTPVEWQFQYFAYREQITPASHAALEGRLERALKRDQRQSELWACLAQIYVDQYAFGFGADASSLDRALAAARRAVEIDRANQFALVALAQVHFFRRDLAAFGPTAERAMALNPLNTDAVGILGLEIVHTGEFERGTAIVLRAMELNPNHAGWMHFAPLWNHFHRGEYEQALERANRVDVPGLFWPYLVVASACGHLGRRADAEAAVRDLLALDPEFAAHARSNIESWHFASGLLEPILEGLCKAGLEIADIAGPPGVVKPPDSGAVRADEGFWVAVLPFKSAGANAELAALAEGFSEEIVTGLSRFPYLRVIARGSTSPYANRDADVRSAGRDLGARYVMEGSIRQAGPRVRFAAQLVDAVSGAHLWAETYDRAFRAEELFELQDDVVPRIVSTCGDRFGVLARAISEAVRARPRTGLTPYESLMRGFGYHFRLSPEEHAESREVLERAVEQAPTNPDCWAMLSWVYSHEHAHGFNEQPGSLDRALSAARRAVDLAPANSLAQQALAVVLFFRKETAGCLSAAERALALNPLDASNESMFLIAFTGDWERGCTLIRRAIDLNPHHPRWFELILGLNEFRLGQYREAVTAFDKADMGESFWKSALLAAAHGQLGERAAASKALRELLALKEDFARNGRAFFENWFDPRLVEGLMDGLRKAGLEIAAESATEAPGTTPVSSPPPSSGASRADEGFWVAVLPFKSAGGSAELSALAEGLSEEIVTGLSRFSYLRVISRSSTVRFGGETADVRSIGKELGARYVMEGSLRQAGPRLRLAVQLVDAASGVHLWAESYERAFSPETVFELQDDLVPRIVSTVADIHGVLPRSMGEAVRNRSPEELSPYEAVLRSFVYFQRVTADELSAARSALELAVRKAPDFADAWAMLAVLCAQDYGQGFELLADPLASGAAAARRAVEVGPSNHLAHFSLAQVLYFQKERQAFRIAAERAAALNPMDGNSIAFMGELLVYSGDFERGLALAGRAKQLNPNHPGWYWYANFYHAYLKGDDAGALDFAHKVNLPKHWGQHVALAATLGQLGERAAAAKAVRDLLAIRPDCAATARGDFEKWWEAEYVERLIDGLRKAGLDVPMPARSEPAGKPAAAVAIAVLPFADMSPAHDQEYLCEGMAEEIMSALVRIDGLRVAARTSAFRAQREGDDPRAIGERLGVGLILEGSVRTAGARLRATAQLIDVASGFQLWSERYDREAADVFAVQDEIAAGVVEAVKSRLAPGERSVRARPHSANLDAYRAYLRGRYLRHTKNDHGGALTAFEEATRLDPSYAPAWVGVAEGNVLAAHYSLIPAAAACASARAALSTAASLQGESTEALYVRGFIAYLEREWPVCEASYRRALEIEPFHVQALGTYGLVLAILGRGEEALELLERVRAADPLAAYPYALTGDALLVLGRAAESERYFEDALSFEKENTLALWGWGAALVALGRGEEAIATLERAVQLSRRAGHYVGMLGWALAVAGRNVQARALLAELRARPAGSPAVVSEAFLLAALGEIDAAFDLLARAESERQPFALYTGLPGFDPLRADKRFRELETSRGVAGRIS